MSKIVIVASLKIKEEFFEEVQAELIKIHKSTHEHDDGCIQYDLHQNLEDKYSFTFVETWENKEAVSAHEGKAHFTDFVAKIQDKIEALEINKLNKLDI